MPYAAEAFFDEVSSDQIKRIWDQLHADGRASFMKESGSKPHITLGVWKEVNVSEANQWIQKFCGQEKRLEIFFYGLGAFTNDPPTVWLAPHASSELCDFHRRFHSVCSVAESQMWDNYKVNSWVPHCTLAFRSSSEKVPKIVETCLNFNLRFSARLESIGLVEISSIKQLSEFSLSGS
jgi:2'-5' RNA ligase